MNRLSFCFFAVTAAGFCSVYGDEPAQPVWPETFTQNFTDISYWPSGSYNTRGTYRYDWPNKMARVDLVSSEWDPYCRPEYNASATPCAHMYSDDKMFLYFPDMMSCCYCCEQKNSDWGLQAPDWLESAKYDGSYIIPVFNGSYSYLSAYKWEVKKYSYYELEAEVPVDRNMISWQQVSSGAARFFDNNRHLTVDSEMTQLPSLCSVDVKCASDLCSD
ncbi:uncharacterized protein LOC134843753 isoform X2 [Symsagittifera roscoffensis]|uniref:uncharacterized protein LOC134843753 isoform X2 n=1 Tax=Symsagittifera roscoffensis TaxID=84072 RepID=UPI00307B37F8